MMSNQRQLSFMHFAKNIRNRATVVLSEAASSSEFPDLRVMVNGMPGPMAVAAAQACLRRGLSLAPCAITGPDVAPQTITVVDEDTGHFTDVKLIPSTMKDEIKWSIDGLKSSLGTFNLLAIDFTHPSAVNSNGEFYVANAIPFVMGTTGGDREKLIQVCNDAGHFCVIAPNMGKQIVAMQKALDDLASQYPGSFGGYQINVIESHQKTKADTSGTAKAVVQSLKRLSGDESFSTETDIEMLRTDADSLEFGVPSQHLGGHAFHTYTLTSPDKSVQFALKHNVSGRRIYAEGTADAVLFLAKKLRTDNVGRVFTMINVLEEGAMY
jgi:4-hydroxy-tetrahydrodipicolinate reductase